MQLTPDDARAHFNLAAALAGCERLAEAAPEYRETLRLASDVVEAHLALGDVLFKQGHASEALGEYRLALAARPEWPAALTRAAWVIATGAGSAAEPGEAVRLLEQARDRTDGTDPDVLRTLAAAYAAAGRIDDAADIARRAVALARAAGLQSLAEAVQRQLAAYEAGR